MLELGFQLFGRIGPANRSPQHPPRNRRLILEEKFGLLTSQWLGLNAAIGRQQSIKDRIALQQRTVKRDSIRAVNHIKHHVRHRHCGDQFPR